MPEVRSRRAQRRFVNLPVSYANPGGLSPSRGQEAPCAPDARSLSALERSVNYLRMIP
jgi:hypothetical protein